MPTFHFDDSNIRWNTLEGFEHLSCSILDIDERNGIIDVLFRFAANRQIVLHRHKALNHLLVIQGEHRLYHADGRLKEIRPVGRYTVSPPSDEPHREGGGAEQDAVVFFSIRGDGLLYEILGDDLQPIGTLGKEDFVVLYAAQQSAAK
ncbi:MAG: regulator [Gammaproteobacteria bacterium]|nr:regulator [Gammaproteobacteria bacterium]